MNWRLGLVLFCLVHGLLLMRPDWALGYDPTRGTWFWGLQEDGIRMGWYGQTVGGLLAFGIGLVLPLRPPDYVVLAAVALNLSLAIGLQIVHPPV
ncbi:MAG: hypothetical protein AAF627_13955 [Myxococcota bacterium]